MDITKLMIGDWVWCGSNYGKVAEIFILHDSLLITVNNRRNKYFEEVNPFEVTTDAEDIRPIPLTQEILEKNGFIWGYTSKEEDAMSQIGVLAEEGLVYDEGAGSIKIIFPNESDGGVIVLSDQNFDRDITFIFVNIIYLHELQHALKLCGIEKEINV